MAHRRHLAFTLIELLVVIAIIALLVSILMPALSKAKELAKRTACLSNLHNLALSTQVYIGDYGEFPFNWQMGIEHPETLSSDWTKTYDGGQHPHYWWESGARGYAHYWTEYFLTLRYAGNAQAMGCAFSPPPGWLVTPGNSGGGGSVTAAEIQKYPTYIYRGPSSADDPNLNIYVGGQIAGDGPCTDKDFESSLGWGARSGTYYPRMAKHSKAKPLFHCPMFTDRGTLSVPEYENYLAPHAPSRGLRNRVVFPMSSGGGIANHYVAESVGWSDGSAAAYEQPQDNRAWFINYARELSTSSASRF